VPKFKKELANELKKLKEAEKTFKEEQKNLEKYKK
jgi:hypothetical protein